MTSLSLDLTLVEANPSTLTIGIQSARFKRFFLLIPCLFFYGLDLSLKKR
jgi:hypothetical protein